ncbi:MAG: ABC transporter permease [Cyanobacteria bacterium J06641_5]
MNLMCIFAVAANSFMEVIRERLLYLAAFFALLLLGAMQLLPKISLGTSEKILLDLGLGAIAILATLVAIFVGTSLLNKEIERRTVLVLIPKPITRSELILGKHFGLWWVTSLMVILMSVFHVVALQLTGQVIPLGAIAISVAFLLLELGLLMAVALLFGSFTNSILAMLLSFGVYVMGHLSEDLLELGELSKSESLAQTTRWLYFVLPDLERLNFRNEAIYDLLPPAPELWATALYGGVYIVVLLAIATTIFQRRQF